MVKLRITKRRLLLVACLIFISVVAISASQFRQSQKDDLRFGRFGVDLEYAKTQEQRDKGLGDRKSLVVDHGMLFLFDQPGTYCFWMKDMHFPIDIVWLNTQKEVVYLKQNVSPSTYPNQFCPATDSTYVLEVNANVTKKWGLGLGDKLIF